MPAASIDKMPLAVLRDAAGSSSILQMSECRNMHLHSQQLFTDEEAATHSVELNHLACIAGSGSQSVPVSISNAADGSAGLYTTWHIAPQFTYTLGASNDLMVSSDYVAVLHFAGKPLASVPLVTVCGRNCMCHSVRHERTQLGSCESLPACSMPCHNAQMRWQGCQALIEQDSTSQHLREVLCCLR